MFRRLILVVLLAAIPIGLVVVYFDPLLGLAQAAWGLEKETLEKLKTWYGLLAGVVAACFSALAFLAVKAWKFVVGRKEKDTETSTGGNTAVFHDKVKIGGDFVQGNKTKIGREDD